MDNFSQRSMSIGDKADRYKLSEEVEIGNCLWQVRVLVTLVKRVDRLYNSYRITYKLMCLGRNKKNPPITQPPLKKHRLSFPGGITARGTLFIMNPEGGENIEHTNTLASRVGTKAGR